MATLQTARFQATASSKRKLLGENDAPISKKHRVGADQVTSPPSHYFLLYEPLLLKLRPSYEVKTMSVMPSTSINKHVDKALEHLGRFSAWDQSVLPGVVFFSAKLNASNKLITISELVRRRIGESEQKWFQYNVLSETECDEASVEEPSVVEDTFMAVDRGTEAAECDSDADDYFETTKTTIYERAVQPVKVKHKSYMSVFFSRVPLDELKTLPNIVLQTNEDRIDLLRKRNMGSVG
ncbi:hypothetical protein B0T25DRAFT_260684 [Lasiosphaeria hispida]|uniref:DNA/RNA-binding protein Alba-like domain-containing protein n=1 Tax=Lasiosphaeria hispida TaxID=260671 RepID=A0AAJ0HG00_9PEZI|nr:hypothetical protein B0T25DRAFT_260684 [Lasiosphaeria hispida]